MLARVAKLRGRRMRARAEISGLDVQIAGLNEGVARQQARLAETEDRALLRGGQPEMRAECAKRAHFTKTMGAAREHMERLALTAHDLDAEEAHAIATRLRVPVDLWPEFCLALFAGGLEGPTDAARAVELGLQSIDRAMRRAGAGK